MSQNLIPRLFDLLHEKPQNESEDEMNKKRSIDIYCIRILIQLTLHSSPSEYQGSYSDSDFASLLLWSIFSNSSDYLRYGGFTIHESWIHSSSSHKELFSSITIPSSFISILTQCPRKLEGEHVGEFISRLRPFLGSVNDALAVVISSIGIGMKFDESRKESLTTSLNTLSLAITNAEHSFRDTWGFPKEDLEKVKKKIEKLSGMIGNGDGMIEMEIDGDIARLDEYKNTIIHLLAQKEEKEEEILI